MANEQPDAPKRPRKPLAESAAWLPVPWELADVSAMQALQSGTADAEQQRRAIDWIIMRAAATYEVAYRPESARDTDFMLGRQFVGQQIVKMLKLSVAALRRNEPNADLPEPR